jgi:GT2 family glycosyltransferase
MSSFLPDFTVSVIIPVYNGGENFFKCLSSLARSHFPPHEIIVVADGETDGSGLMAETYGAKVLRTPSRLGPAHARNLGARMAHGNLLFFLDADIAISPDTIDYIAGIFKDRPDLAAVIGSYDDEPAADNFLSKYKNLFHHYIHQTAREEASTFWGACGAIRSEIFYSIGGFDERYRHPSIEDIELGHRLRQAGHRIWLCKNLKVKHLKRWKITSLLKSDFFHRALPWTELILKERWLINDLNLKGASRISMLLTYGLLGSLIGVGFSSHFLPPTLILVLALLAINGPLYRFFQKKCGSSFAILTIPWHWLYYLYSGFAVSIGIVLYLLRRWRFLKATASTAPGC